MSRDLRVSGYVPKRWVAKRLWAAGVYEVALLQHAERWETLADAWRECDLVELVLPLAILRGAPALTVVRVAGGWLADAYDVAVGPGGEWPDVDRDLLGRCVVEAAAPDFDVVRLGQLRDRAIRRAGARAPGLHRYRLLTAAAHLAALGIQRAYPTGAGAADAELVGEHSLGAVRDAATRTELDLFSPLVDAEAYETAALLLARASVDVDESLDESQATVSDA